MIIIYTGGIGSGKSLSIVKEIVDRRQHTYTNFELNNLKYERLKYEHLFTTDDKKKMTLNFKYWNKQVKKGGFDIFLDEFHSVMNSRRSMSKQNVLLSNFLSQIRKILGESELNNLYLISQKLRRIDVNSRDLAHKAIKCEKFQFSETMPTEVIENGKMVTKRLPITMIYKYHFADADALNAYEAFGINTCQGVTRFIGNPYFKYYNSYELIDFGSEEFI